MKHALTLPALMYLASGCLAPANASPSPLFIDSTAGTINGASSGVVNGTPFRAGEVVNGVRNFYFFGDLMLNDSVTGSGNYGVSFRVGNNVTITNSAVINFSATASNAGAGGGAGATGGAGALGGSGGVGGAGGRGGLGGVGGDVFFSAAPGRDGGSGNPGDASSGGATGAAGQAGAAGVGGSAGGSAGLAGSGGSSRIGATGGSGGRGGAAGSRAGDPNGDNGTPGRNASRPAESGFSGAAGGAGGGGRQTAGSGLFLSGGGGGGSGGGGGGGGGGRAGAGAGGGGGGGGGYAFLGGGRGGVGGSGGAGGNAGTGGRGGEGGAGAHGGGAFGIGANGRVSISGATASAQGGTVVDSDRSGSVGTSGTPGSPGGAGAPGATGTSTTGSGGDGGAGAAGSAGTAGGFGGAGGAAGGGAGGSIALVGTVLQGVATMNLDARGGLGTGNVNNGDAGRLLFGSNTAVADPALGLGTIERHAGQRAVNPFIQGSVLTPLIADLEGGAEGFGYLSTLSALSADFTTLRVGAPMDAIAALMRLDVGPTGYGDDYTGFDMLLLVNLTGGQLVRGGLGVGGAAGLTASLLLGGYARDAEFGGMGDEVDSLFDAFGVYATLVRDSDLVFNAAFDEGSISQATLGDGDFAYILRSNSTSQIPVPGTISLVALALPGLALARRRPGASSRRPGAIRLSLM